MGRYLSKIIASLLLLCGLTVPAFAQVGSVATLPRPTWLDNNGNPAASGTVNSYVCGTTTPKDTFSDSTLSTALPNPITLNSAGRAQTAGNVEATVYLSPACYKFLYKNSAGTTIYTVDNYYPANYLGSGTASTSTFLRGDYTWAKPVTVLTSTSVGTQTPLAPGIVGTTYVRLNNASLLTIATFEAGYDGQEVELQSIGAGQVDINDSASALGTAAQRILTGANQTISLAPGLGRMRMRYDGTTARWRVILHEQGQIIGYTTTWAGGSPSIGNGSLNAHYYVRGKQVMVHIYLSPGSTTTFGAGAYTFTLPFTASGTTVGQSGTAMIFDTSASAFFVGAAYVNTTTTITVGTNSGQLAATVPMTWASGDLMMIELTYYLP